MKIWKYIIIPICITERKHWKEYFLEFLMIFLAVTLGFFAENIRESLSNREIERNNIQSVITNLTDDSLQLAAVIQFNETRLNGIDTFLSLKKMNIKDTVIKKRFYYYALVYAAYFRDFISNDATIEQMKASGSLRLIKKQNISDSILKYEYINKVIKSNEDVLGLEYSKMLDGAAKLFDLTIYNNPSVQQGFLAHNVNVVPAEELNDINQTDPFALNEYYNFVSEQSLSLKYYVQLLLNQLTYIRNLIPFLKKAYNLR